MTTWGDARVFVDTNILYYAIDADAGEKHDRATDVIKTLWRTRSGCLSPQVLSEWAVNLHKKLEADWPRIKSMVEPYLTWRVVPIEPVDPLEAIRIAGENRLSFWDGLIVRAASRARAKFLLTEDMNPGQVIEGVQVKNPFLP